MQPDFPDVHRAVFAGLTIGSEKQEILLVNIEKEHFEDLSCGFSPTNILKMSRKKLASESASELANSISTKFGQ